MAGALVAENMQIMSAMGKNIFLQVWCVASVQTDMQNC